jgi:hypothetical protein
VDDELSEACNTHTNGSDEKYIRSLNGKPEGKTRFGRSSRRWKNIIGIDHREIE